MLSSPCGASARACSPARRQPVAQPAPPERPRARACRRPALATWRCRKGRRTRPGTRRPTRHPTSRVSGQRRRREERCSPGRTAAAVRSAEAAGQRRRPLQPGPSCWRPWREAFKREIGKACPPRGCPARLGRFQGRGSVDMSKTRDGEARKPFRMPPPATRPWWLLNSRCRLGRTRPERSGGSSQKSNGRFRPTFREFPKTGRGCGSMGGRPLFHFSRLRESTIDNLDNLS